MRCRVGAMRFQSGKEHSGKKRCAVPHSVQELWAERARERERELVLYAQSTSAVISGQ